MSGEVSESPEEHPSSRDGGFISERLEEHVSSEEDLSSNPSDSAQDASEDIPSSGHFSDVQNNEDGSDPGDEHPDLEGSGLVLIESPSINVSSDEAEDGSEPENISDGIVLDNWRSSGIFLGLGCDEDVNQFSKFVESTGGEESWEHSPEDIESSVKSDFLSEFKLRSSSGLPFPGSGKSGGEGGTDDGPVGGFGDCWYSSISISGSETEPFTSTTESSNEPRDKDGESPSPGPDTSDLTGMGAVGEVVSGGDVRELTSKSSSGTMESKETEDDESPVGTSDFIKSELGNTINRVVLNDGTIFLGERSGKEPPEVELPWDGEEESKGSGVSGISPSSSGPGTAPSADG